MHQCISSVLLVVFFFFFTTWYLNTTEWFTPVFAYNRWFCVFYYYETNQSAVFQFVCTVTVSHICFDGLFNLDIQYADGVHVK